MKTSSVPRPEPRKRRCILPLVIAVMANLALILASQAQEPPLIHDIAPVVDESTPEGWLSLRATVPANAMVTLEVSTDVAAGRWMDYSPPTLSSPSGELQLLAPALPEGSPNAFFRLRVEAPAIAVRDDGKTVTVRTTEPVPAGLLFQALGQGKEIGFYGTDQLGPFTMLPPLDLSAANVEDLFASMGQRVWVTPTAEDDPAEAERLAAFTTFQDDPLPPQPGETGDGRMDDGFRGDSALPAPPRGVEEPPEPGPSQDKRFVVDLAPALPEDDQREDPSRTEPGRHLRLQLKLRFPDGVEARFATEATGASPVPAAPSHVEEGAVVFAVRSSVAGAPNGTVYHVGATPDPFVRRAYGRLFEDGHGDGRSNEATLQLPVPLPENVRDIGGLTVELYRATRSLPEGALLGGAIERYADRLLPVGRVTGDELARLVALAATGWTGPDDIKSNGLPEPTLTLVHQSGSKAAKYNFVIMGEGFADTPGDQALFNDYVEDVVMNGLFTHDVYPEILNAMNIYRINTFSKDSGVTQINSQGQVTVPRDTALDMRYSGLWADCYFKLGPDTKANADAILAALIPETDLIAIVVNETGAGGCGGGGGFFITRGEGWDVFAHEMGHGATGLGDEYSCSQNSPGCPTYGGDEPGEPNLTTETSRAQIKWNRWIPSTRPIPTHWTEVSDVSQDVGLFPGATRGSTKYGNGLFRPARISRMSTTETNLHSPVAYTQIRDDARAYQLADFRRSVVGDFDGDGRTDVVLLDDRQLSLYLAADRDVGPDDLVTGQPPRPVTGVLEPTWYHTGQLRNPGHASWSIRNSDKLLPADFDGDGMTDLFVVNLTHWSIPYFGMLRSTGTGFVPVARYDLELPAWDDMREHDEFYVGDFSGDGRDDLMVFNGRDWSVPYFIMLRSTGTSLVYSRRYSETLPGGFSMGDHERFLVGNFDGDAGGREEVASLNRQDWNQVHLMVFTSDGSKLSLADRHYGTIDFPPFPYPAWTMRTWDQVRVLDFNGDGRSDLAFFNGLQWETEYLGLFACTAQAKLTPLRRYSDDVPGWNMRAWDQYRVADVNGDGNDDLVVYNSVNWQTQYLGMLRSDGLSELQGSWQKDWIGGWNLGAGDAFHVADFRGAAGWDDLIVYNEGWMGLLRSKSNRYQLETLYRKWIHNHRFHAFGWW